MVKFMVLHITINYLKNTSNLNVYNSMRMPILTNFKTPSKHIFLYGATSCHYLRIIYKYGIYPSQYLYPLNKL